MPVGANYDGIKKRKPYIFLCTGVAGAALVQLYNGEISKSCITDQWLKYLRNVLYNDLFSQLLYKQRMQYKPYVLVIGFS